VFKYRSLPTIVWAFDCEWIPDPTAGRLLYDLSDEVSDAEVMEVMWKQGGATAEKARPVLKPVMSRVVSISAVARRTREDGSVGLVLRTLPDDAHDPVQCREREIIERFLGRVGELKPFLAGFNSTGADIRVLIQRAVVHGISLPEFCARPKRPWDGADYFSKDSDYHIDLFQILAGYGKGGPSLHELATLSGIPGKLGVGGEDVPLLWLEGRLPEITAYNECDALTTYLLWLRACYVAGHLDLARYMDEQLRVLHLLRDDPQYAPRAHLARFLDEWKRLQTRIGSEFARFF
jgi:3'-5' exonuclease